MSYPNLEEKNVYIFSEGKSLALANTDVSAISGISPSFNIGQQLDYLVEVINNLAKTTNRNAFFLKNLSDKFGKENAQNELTSVIANHLKGENECYQAFLNAGSPEEFSLAIQNLTNADSKKEFKQFDKQIFCSNLKELSMENKRLKADFLAQSMTAKKTQDDFWEKMTDLESKIASLEHISSLSEELRELKESHLSHSKRSEERFASVENAISDSSRSLSDQSKQIEDLEKKFKTEFKFISQKIEEANRVIRSQGELQKAPSGSQHSIPGDLFARYLELEQFRVFKRLTEEALDALDKRLAECNVESLHVFLENRLGQFAKELRSKQPPVSTPSQPNVGSFVSVPEGRGSGLNQAELLALSKQGQLAEERLSELDEKLSDIERNLNKKIIGVDQRLKDIEDVKKLNKLVSRMQMDLNLKVNKEAFEAEVSEKLAKNEFFDFVNQNLITLDQLKTVQHDLGEFKEHSSNVCQALDQSLKALRALFSKFQESTEKGIDGLNQKNSDARNLISQLEKTLGDLNSRFDFLEQKFRDTKERVFALINARLNSLATTRQLACLSCGAKDINYPPISAQIQGENGALFTKDPLQVTEAPVFSNGIKYKTLISASTKNKESANLKTDPVSNSRELEVENKEPATNFKKFSDEQSTTNPQSNNRRFSGLSKSRLTSNYGPRPGREGQFVTGSQVFGTKQIVKEHQEKLHAPVDFLIRSNELTKSRLRPFSSIPQRYKLKNMQN